MLMLDYLLWTVLRRSLNTQLICSARPTPYSRHFLFFIKTNKKALHSSVISVTFIFPVAITSYYFYLLIFIQRDLVPQMRRKLRRRSGLWGVGTPTCEEAEPSASAWGRQSPEWGRNPGKEHVFLLHREWRKNKYQISVKCFTCFLLQRELWNDGASWAVSFTGCGGGGQKAMDEQGLSHKPTYILLHLHLHNTTCIVYRHTSGKAVVKVSTLWSFTLFTFRIFSSKHLSFGVWTVQLGQLHAPERRWDNA